MVFIVLVGEEQKNNVLSNVSWKIKSKMACANLDMKPSHSKRIFIMMNRTRWDMKKSREEKYVTKNGYVVTRISERDTNIPCTY